MILQALVALAEREKLVEDPDFEKKRVDYVVRIKADGTFVNLESRIQENGKGKEEQVPRIPTRTGNILPRFLTDDAKWVLGIGDPKKDKPARLLKYVEAFRGLVDEAAAASDADELKAVSRFYAALDANRALLNAANPAIEWTGSENLAFALAGRSGLVHESSPARTWWKEQRRQPVRAKSDAAPGALTTVRCLVTGAVGPVKRTHALLKRVPDGQTSGTALVSFNSGAFESQGHKQGDNAPVSEAAADAYVTAINWLLEKPEAEGRPYRYGVRLGDGAVALFWTKRARAVMDLFAEVFTEPKPDEVRRLLSAPHAGSAAGGAIDDDAFYVLVIGGNAARAVVLDWIETPLAEVCANLKRYFDDLAIVGQSEPLPLWKLLSAIDPPGSASVPPDLGSRLFMSAIRGTPIPREILRHALMRLRVPPDRREGADHFVATRCALIKAALCGAARAHPDSMKYLEVGMALDDKKQDQAYVLGRLFALLEWIQSAALGKTNATIRDRYFSAASSSPASVFPLLLKLSTKHESKIGGGLEYLFDERKRQIMSLLEANRIPSFMPLEEQGLFAIGYYHERERLFQDRRERSDAKKSKEDASAA